MLKTSLREDGVEEEEGSSRREGVKRKLVDAMSIDE